MRCNGKYPIAIREYGITFIFIDMAYLRGHINKNCILKYLSNSAMTRTEQYILEVYSNISNIL